MLSGLFSGPVVKTEIGRPDKPYLVKFRDFFRAWAFLRRSAGGNREFAK